MKSNDDINDPDSREPVPAPNIAALTAYSIPRVSVPTDLQLDSNEGRGPGPEWLDALRDAGDGLLNRYRKPVALEARYAQMLRIEPSRVLATCGGDDGIDRACRVYLQPDREIVLPSPTFAMFSNFSRMSGGRVVRVPWLTEEFPLDETLRAVTPRTGMIVLVSPNNPTGAVVPRAALLRLSQAAPHALILLDGAYAHFADVDLTNDALSLPNVLILHTMSKAWGLAGVRVGFAFGPEEIIGCLRKTSCPYPVSNISAVLAEKWLAEGGESVACFVDEVRKEREILQRELASLGARPWLSQGNFAFARFRDAPATRDALAALGIAVRFIPGEPDFKGGLRITCPGNAADFDRLLRALRIALDSERKEL